MERQKRFVTTGRCKMGLEIWHRAGEGSGRDHFAKALAEATRSIPETSSIGNVGINFISGLCKKNYFNVLRIDGVYYDVERMKRNDAIKNAIQKHDLVIYQSQSSKLMAEKILKVKARKSAVICNGTAMRPDFEESNRSNRIVASARWRPNKRPYAIASAFCFACDELGLDADMSFIGDIDKQYRINHPRITYHGSMPHHEMKNLFMTSKVMVHVCHIDSCPNSVIEGLRMGLRLVCNNIGGTPELASSHDLVLQIDKPFDFRPIFSMSAVADSSVDHKIIGHGMVKAFDNFSPIYRKDFDISVCAKKYVEAIVNAMQK